MPTRRSATAVAIADKGWKRAAAGDRTCDGLNVASLRPSPNDWPRSTPLFDACRGRARATIAALTGAAP
jgi:hypothetical protein